MSSNATIREAIASIIMIPMISLDECDGKQSTFCDRGMLEAYG